jgi:hypothetical protein
MAHVFWGRLHYAFDNFLLPIATFRLRSVPEGLYQKDHFEKPAIKRFWKPLIGACQYPTPCNPQL